MGAKTNIEWTDATWNPVSGCSKISQGCKNCYAETWAKRHMGEFSKDQGRKFTDIRLHEEKLKIPLRWKRPRRIFVNSMSDLFHEQVPDSFLDQVFAVASLAPQHTFQVLTKRSERMPTYCGRTTDECGQRWQAVSEAARKLAYNMPRGGPIGSAHWPLSNVWLGVSVENQKTADERIHLLLQTPASVRFLSCEPLLGPIDLKHIADPNPKHRKLGVTFDALSVKPGIAYLGVGIDWIIVGGESGLQARPMHPDWVRSIRDQCQEAGVPFFFKQWGQHVPATIDSADFGLTIGGKVVHPFDGAPMRRVQSKTIAGNILDGKVWEEFPRKRRETHD